jgi:hypothetical protein
MVDQLLDAIRRRALAGDVWALIWLAKNMRPRT